MRKGGWDSTNTDLSRYKLSDMEMLQKRASVVSKNKEAARIEWAQKQEMLKQGIVPKEMQEVMKKPKPTPAKRECFSTLKRPSSARPSTTAATLTKTQQARYSGLRTTAGTDPQAATIKPQAPESAEKGDETFESLKRLDEAMSQLERAMVSAIQDPVPSKFAPPTSTLPSYPGVSTKYFPESPTTDYSVIPVKYSPEPQKLRQSPPKRYSPEADEGMDEVSESSVFSLSPDHSQEVFHPQKYRDEYDEDKISVIPSWQEYENVEPATQLSFPEPKTSENARVGVLSDPLEEPNICSVETADYLAQMLEQTRKDLEQMQIPDQCTSAEEFPALPPVQSFGRNYDADLMPRPYVLKPIAKELHNPVVRSPHSLAISSSLGPAPQKYAMK